MLKFGIGGLRRKYQETTSSGCLFVKMPVHGITPLRARFIKPMFVFLVMQCSFKMDQLMKKVMNNFQG